MSLSAISLSPRQLTWIKRLCFLLGLCPLLILLNAAWQNQLGPNPIERITHRTGYWTLTFLLITLAVTPLRRLTGWLWLTRLRRMLGLFGFFYVCLHFSTYLVLDQFFDWPAISADILKRPYITIGFAAFVLMIPLAITSTQAMMAKLGGKRWRRLHSLIYIIAIAGVVHFIWLVKKDLSKPLTFAAWLAVLLLIRIIYWISDRNRRKRAR